MAKPASSTPVAPEARKRTVAPKERTRTDAPEPRTRLDVHEAITAKIVAAIEAGAGKFEMPWHRPGISTAIPKNASTEKAYRGSNILSLWIDAAVKAYEHPLWATFKQWQELGAAVRKGEKGSLIVKYGEWVPRADAGGHQKREQKNPRESTPPADTVADGEDAAKRLFAKAAWVFNIGQVELPDELRARLLPPEEPRADLTVRLAHVDRFIAATGAEFREGGQRAFYRHRAADGTGDFIQMPPRTLFTGTATSTPTEAYESTRLHELVHFSGAGHRLDRQFGERFADKAYAFEELVAELGAAFLCAELEITNTPRLDHAQYLAHWLEVLKDDKRAIFTAASLATRAVDYLNGLQSAPDEPSAPRALPDGDAARDRRPPAPAPTGARP